MIEYVMRIIQNVFNNVNTAAETPLGETVVSIIVIIVVGIIVCIPVMSDAPSFLHQDLLSDVQKAMSMLQTTFIMLRQTSFPAIFPMRFPMLMRRI